LTSTGRNLDAVLDRVAHDLRPVDVNLSDWDCTLESATNGLALRLGFRQAKGVREEDIRRLIAARGDGYPTAERLWGRGGTRASCPLRVSRKPMPSAPWALDRRQALWAVRGLGEAPLPLFAAQEKTTAEDATDGAMLPVHAALAACDRGLPRAADDSEAPPARLPARGAEAAPRDGQPRSLRRRNGEKITIAGLVLCGKGRAPPAA